MVSLNKSFVFGICFASFTWCVCLYLYYQLNQSENRSNHGTRQYLLSNSILDMSDGKSKVAGKGWRKSHISQILFNSLQPVPVEDLDDIGIVRSLTDKEVKDYGLKVHAFNILVSNRLGLIREVPDTRHKLCKNIHYDISTLPTISIIICFYNEHTTTLMRSIMSIMRRTPKELLREILLIDDFSDLENLHSDIDQFVNSTEELEGKVKLIRTERREGLIRARIIGARKARGSVLVFLDSHIEVNVQWVEPLLERIMINITTIAIPVIDVINAHTFVYSASPLVRGGFNWGLHFKWENLPAGTLKKDEDFIKPIKSPTMAGGLFAVNRILFLEMGEYDPEMNIWGGENLEISFRFWMCGGQLELVPCSRVGHVFRQRRPYGSPDGQDTMLFNSLRVAHVWMDQYKQYFLARTKNADKIDVGDLSERRSLRRLMKCKNFEWYLNNIYPELALPDDNEAMKQLKWSALEQDKFQPWHARKRNYMRSFQIRLSDTKLCMQSSKDVKTKNSLLVLRPCIKAKHQIWFETDKSEFILSRLLCLNADQPEPHLYKCHEMGSDQEWKHKGASHSPIYNMAAGTCLGVRKAEAGAIVMMTLCNDPTFNKWDLVDT